jgi:hypothetical protein
MLIEDCSKAWKEMQPTFKFHPLDLPARFFPLVYAGYTEV